MQMPFPKGNTALNCCWQVRASHHPQQPLSCGRFGLEEVAAQKDPFQAEKKSRTRVFQGDRGRRSLGMAPPASQNPGSL